MQRFFKILKYIALIFGVFFLITYTLLLYFARDIETMVTFPGTDINLKELTNHPAGLIVAEDIFIETDSGEIIHGIYVDNNMEKTVYYFHGNGAPMEYFYTEMRYISDLGYNLIAYDYPGYGKSTGKPTVENIHKFSETFFEYAKNNFDIQDKNLIIWGYSIGTAVAVDFAKDRDFNALVLFSPLASRYEMSEKFFGFPVQKTFFLPDSLISKESIKNITEPTLIIHGNKDLVVPIEQGRNVYNNSAASEKKFIEVDNFGHSLIVERYGDVLKSFIIEFLNDYQVIPEISKVGDENLQENNAIHEQEILLNRERATKILEAQKLLQYIVSLDIITDTSITKYVDPDISFQDITYIPDNMRPLDLEYIRDIKGDLQLRDEAANSFENLAFEFYRHFGKKIEVVSSYRSYDYQAGIKSRGCPDTLCAKAGHSEHQSGLALDIFEASTQAAWQNNEEYMEYFIWMQEHAHLYGWHNTYQNGREIDGYEIEPWHWRYLGEELASYLSGQNVSFAEYYEARDSL